MNLPVIKNSLLFGLGERNAVLLLPHASSAHRPRELYILIHEIF